MEPEEYKGYMIVEAPGWMFKATKIVPSSHLKRTFNACTVESLKISINNELNKKNQLLERASCKISQYFFLRLTC